MANAGSRRYSPNRITVLFLLALLIPTQMRAASPSITSLTPSTGAVGASVTIAGSNLGSTQGSSIVKFNGTTATVTSDSSWLEKFERYYLPGVAARMPRSGFFTERDSMFEGAVLDEIFDPRPYLLVDIAVKTIKNSNGSYTLSWTVPAGIQSYRVKQSSRTIVDWLNFNPRDFTYGFDPAPNQPWFSAADVANAPGPAAPGSTQSFTASGLDPSHPWHLAMKAYVTVSSPAAR